MGLPGPSRLEKSGCLHLSTSNFSELQFSVTSFLHYAVYGAARMPSQLEEKRLSPSQYRFLHDLDMENCRAITVNSIIPGVEGAAVSISARSSRQLADPHSSDF
ncbi:hypothetical protein RRG08_019716 [Elysia crispata]|uniref:Uncharacterized protein n=1 Tax=Elysia crispata TaxID=231223 RepID=A0AAE1A941_9GAST|nr:hypothetical protein RRG08_019716 [Elysia crispata]